MLSRSFLGCLFLLISPVIGCGEVEEPQNSELHKCEAVLFEIDNGIDGSIDITITHHYDDSGRLFLEKVDQDANGYSDRTTTYYYDNLDRVVLQEIDKDADGSADYFYSYFDYDEYNNPTKAEFDLGEEGIIVLTYFYSYDGNGNLLLTETDSDGDGIADSITTASEHNELGFPGIIETDSNGDGITDTVTTATEYNGDGYPTLYLGNGIHAATKSVYYECM